MSEGQDIPQPLRSSRLRQHLPPGHPMAQSLHLLGIVDSTSDLALANGRAHRSAAQGQRSLHGRVFTAEGQRKGRGRRGTTWVSSARRGLYLSVAVQPLPAPSLMPYLPLIPAVALATTLESLGLRVGLKWPNDVWLDGSKVAGTLIDIDSDADAQAFAVIGIGLNINQLATELPPATDCTATSLRISLGSPQSRELITARLLSSLQIELANWQGASLQSASLDTLCQSFMKRDVLVGRTVTLSAAGQIIAGKIVVLEPARGVTLLTDTGQEHLFRAEHVHIQRVH